MINTMGDHNGLVQQAMAKAQGTNLPLNNYMQQVQQPPQPPRCECHECTQARWKMFAGGGLAQMGRL